MEWCISGHPVSKQQVVFFTQVLLVYIIVLSSIVNICLQFGDQNIWVILLSSGVGYMLPSPSLKNERILREFTEQHTEDDRIQSR